MTSTSTRADGPVTKFSKSRLVPLHRIEES